MLKSGSHPAAFVLAIMLSPVNAQEYSVELIDAPPDADDISEALAEQFDHGVRVKRGASRTACEIWFCKQWNVDAGFKASDERLYPFTPGQLIGLLHFRRRGSDFRDQTVGSGWYTLRFGLQPVDGNHVGTSPTHDFLVLVDAGEDEPDKNWELKDLMKSSANAAGSTHPAMLSLQRAGDGSQVAIRHDESNDWWVLHVVGTGTANENTQVVPVDVVVIGHAAE
jgi:hypothetical protein